MGRRRGGDRRLADGDGGKRATLRIDLERNAAPRRDAAAAQQGDLELAARGIAREIA
jgi:hypothetical protein